MVTLKDIDFGSADAESDERLGEYFVATGYVHEALTGKKTVFLGRKGRRARPRSSNSCRGCTESRGGPTWS